MLPKTNIVLPFNRQYFSDTAQVAHNTGRAVQYWRKTQLQTLVNLLKRCMEILLVENPHHSVQKTDDRR